jgi:DNA-binding XRE family transcriptional regulator
MLRPAQLQDFDLQSYFGLPAVAKKLQGLRCDKCGWETIDAATLYAVGDALAGLLLESPERMAPQVLRFMRMRLDLTQQELAKKMGLSRKTINEWETKGRISPQNDLLLRTLVYTHLAESFRPRLGVLDHVRMAAPKKLAPVIVSVPRIDRAASVFG